MTYNGGSNWRGTGSTMAGRSKLTATILTVLLGAAVFIFLPGGGAAGLSVLYAAQPGPAPRLPAASMQEAALLEELLRLDARLAAAAARRAEAAAQEERWRAEEERAAGRLRELGLDLAESRARLGDFLRFAYQAGGGRFLAVLLGEGDWAEMVTRWELLRRILDYGLQRLEATADLAAAQRAEQARLAEARRAAAASREEAEALWRQLDALRRAREAALAEARRQGTELGREGARMSEQWQALLPVLRGHLRAFAAFPWQSLNPDRLQLEPPAGLRVEIGEETLNRAFAGYPDLRGVSVRFTAGGLALEGRPEKAPSYRLEGRLVLEGNDVLRLVPEAVFFGEYQASEELLRELAAPEELSFRVQENSGFRVTGVETATGKLVLRLRPR